MTPASRIGHRALRCAQARVLAYWSYGKVLVRSCGITQVGAISALEVKSCEHSLLQFFASISNRRKGMHGVLLKVASGLKSSKNKDAWSSSLPKRLCTILIVWLLSKMPGRASLSAQWRLGPMR